MVACGENAVEFIEIQPQNGKRMPAKSYLNGKRLGLGDRVYLWVSIDTN